MGDLWDSAVAAVTGLTVAWVTGRRAVGWARGRCDQALDAAAALPSGRERNLALVTASPTGPVEGAPARSERAVQQALDGG